MNRERYKGAGMSINKIVAGLGTAAALLLVPSRAPAQDELRGKLAMVKSLKCTFPVVAVGRWSGSQPEAQVKKANLVLQFVEINADEGTARLEAGAGAYDIVVRYAGGYLHFIQSLLD